MIVKYPIYRWNIISSIKTNFDKNRFFNLWLNIVAIKEQLLHLTLFGVVELHYLHYWHLTSVLSIWCRWVALLALLGKLRQQRCFSILPSKKKKERKKEKKREYTACGWTLNPVMVAHSALKDRQISAGLGRDKERAGRWAVLIQPQVIGKSKYQSHRQPDFDVDMHGNDPYIERTNFARVLQPKSRVFFFWRNS